MLHAVGVPVVECLIHAAMSQWNRGIVNAEVANMKLVQAHVAETPHGGELSSSHPRAGFIGVKVGNSALGSIQCDVDGIRIAGDIGIYRGVGWHIDFTL